MGQYSALIESEKKYLYFRCELRTQNSRRKKSIILPVFLLSRHSFTWRVVQYSKAHCHNCLLISSSVLNKRRRRSGRSNLKQRESENAITRLNCNTDSTICSCFQAEMIEIEFNSQREWIAPHHRFNYNILSACALPFCCKLYFERNFLFQLRSLSIFNLNIELQH